MSVLFLTNWPTYQYVVFGGIAPIWYYALPAAIVLPILFAKPETIVRLCREPLFWWFALYVVSGAVWLLLSQAFMEDASQQWRLRVLALFFFFSTAVVTIESKRFPLVLAVLSTLVLASVFNWWDALRPHVFVPLGIEGGAAGRGAGLFINSNRAAAFVLAATITLLPFVPLHMRGILLLVGFVGIAPTFSRSGLLCAGIVVVLAVALKLIKRAQVLLLVLAIPLIAAGTAVYYDVLLSSSDDPNLNRIVQRLNWFQDMESDDSIEDRIYPAIRAWEMFLDAPVTGKGVGVTSRPLLGDGTHNMYLLLMAEQGFLGLLLYLSLIGLLAWRGWTLSREAVSPQLADVGRAMLLYAMFIAFYGFFSHSILEEPHGIFLMAFITAAAFQDSIRARPGDSFAHPYSVRM
jgi:O-antigen ligase